MTDDLDDVAFDADDGELGFAPAISVSGRTVAARRLTASAIDHGARWPRGGAASPVAPPC